ncbi:putative MFS multidrug transporter [Xylogone sp. PMI_703]|nr:putative MFS multidrug transporter [Xylogone sp. PMI_703]
MIKTAFDMLDEEPMAVPAALPGPSNSDPGSDMEKTSRHGVLQKLSDFITREPSNWSRFRRWNYTFLLASMPFCVQWSSSIFSTAIPEVTTHFNVGTEVASLGTSLFLLGFGTGALLWAPVSEWQGRRRPFLFGFTGFVIFQIPLGVARNIATILVSRFIQGFLGSSTLAVIAGALADIWPTAVDRAVSMTIFCMATFSAPVAGSVVGGFIAQAGYSWRWVAWITMLISAIPGVLGWTLMVETYKPHLHGESYNRTFSSKFKSFCSVYLLRPSKMFFLEPIVFFCSVYLALAYGIFYLFFTAYPISFHQHRHWAAGVASLPFLAILVGLIIAALFIIVQTKISFARKSRSGEPYVPEDRLLPMMIGSILLSAGLFMFGWTSSPNITWVPQVLAGAPIGFGIFAIFLSSVNFVVDCYKRESNSAFAVSSLLRGFAGTAFPLFASKMYDALGVNWATSVLGFATVLLVPIPFLFYKFGPRIRSKSRYTPRDLPDMTEDQGSTR